MGVLRLAHWWTRRVGSLTGMVSMDWIFIFAPMGGFAGGWRFTASGQGTLADPNELVGVGGVRK